MTPNDRLMAAFTDHAPDRVPVVPKIWFHLAATLMGIQPRAVIEDPALALRLLIDAAIAAGADAARIFFTPKRRTRLEAEKLIEVDDRGTCIGVIDLAGGWATHVDHHTGLRLDDPYDTAFHAYRQYPGPCVADLGDARRIAVPDKAFWAAEFGGHVRQTLAYAGDRAALIGDCDSATLAWYIRYRGMEQAMLDLLDNPRLVHAVMEKGVAYAVERGRFCIDAGLRVLRLNDSVANMLVISPSSWRCFIQPHMTEVCSELHAYCPEVKVYCHICGNILPVIEELVATGLDCIGPLDPMGGFTVAEVRDRVGPNVTLLGGVDTMAFLHSSPDQLYDAARRCLDQGSVGGGRYILSSGCVVPPAASLPHLRALTRAAWDHAGSESGNDGHQ